MGFFGWREYERLPDRCAHCGKSGRMTMDHILPVSRGGSHWLHNIQKLCYPCNNAKGNRLEAWTLDRRLILYSDAADLARQLEKVNQ
jgi:5-methylcytosine-specific restriction endonuclease McrA